MMRRTKTKAQLWIYLIAALFFMAAIITSATLMDPPQEPDLRQSWKTALVERCMPAIVRIEVTATPPEMKPDPDNPFPATPQPQHWWGSGVIVSARGLVVSAYHVLAVPEDWTIEATAYLLGGAKVQLKVAYLWKAHDLSLGQLPARKKPYPFVVVASRKPLVGEEVLAMGNPYALGHSVSSGIVSALGRKFYLQLEMLPRRRLRIFLSLRQSEPPYGATQMIDMIQFDAPLNPGNSGGGLFNRYGELIGQTNAGMQGDGLGFAVPAKFIREMLLNFANKKASKS